MTRRELTLKEATDLELVELPERAVMSLVNLNAALPINAAVAANVLSDNAVAAGVAQQTAPIGQGVGGGMPSLPTL